MMDHKVLSETSWQLRRTILGMIHRAGSGHSGGSLSCAEILTVLYDDVLNIDSQNPSWNQRDRFILSKGHAAPALYATLARKGFFDSELLNHLRQFGSPLQGHPCMKELPGIEMSTGSLGLGISVGVGMALAARRRGENYGVWVLCGDGELQEGSNWEGMMSAYKWKLDNLTVIIDHNGVQLDGTVEQVMPMGDLKSKIASFGLSVLEVDGHDTAQLQSSFREARAIPGPTAIIAKTVKGKGVSFMEGKSTWHGKQINAEEYQIAMAELEARP